MEKVGLVRNGKGFGVERDSGLETDSRLEKESGLEKDSGLEEQVKNGWQWGDYRRPSR